MRAEPLPVSDFLPHQERLIKCPDTFPFHYAWAAENIRTPKYLRVAPVYTDGLHDAENWKGTNKLLGGKLQDAIDELAEYMQKEFRDQLDGYFDPEYCLLTDDPNEKDCLVIETAIVALVPTQALLNVAGGAVDLVVPGVAIATAMLSDGCVGVECRVRDAMTGEIVAMYATTEADETAVISFSQFTRMGPAKKNIESIAKMNAELFYADDPNTVKRAFPIKLFSF